MDLDKQLVFTPNYGRPLKVTRAPRKRQTEYLSEEELDSFGFDKSQDRLVEESKILSALDLVYSKNKKQRLF